MFLNEKRRQVGSSSHLPPRCDEAVTKPLDAIITPDSTTSSDSEPNPLHASNPSWYRTRKEALGLNTYLDES